MCVAARERTHVIGDSDVAKQSAGPELDIVPGVLIVDDDDLVLGRLQETVTAAGYRVRTAGSGAEALHSLEESFASIIVADLNMADMGGLELCRRIRGRAWPGYPYIILLTAQDEEKHVHAGLVAGADDYISKRTYAPQFLARLRAGKRFLALECSLNNESNKQRKLTTTDAWTGVYDRHYFMRNLKHELTRSQHSGGSVAMLLLDFDHFTKVNNTCGHVIGDIALKRLTRQILKCLDRATAWCAHLGGEEFAVVLEDTTLTDARSCAERVRQAMTSESVKNSQGGVHIDVSIGIGAAEEIVSRHVVTVESLLKLASANLYAGKHCKNGRVASLSPHVPEAARHRSRH
jgi:two-component system, cell cycle response regulator